MFKKKSAFTILEIVVAIFIISIVTAISIPIIINDTKEATYISNWKKQFDETKYVFNLMKINDSQELEAAVMDGNPELIIYRYLLYMGVPLSTLVPADDYTLRGLDNKIIDKDSPYHIQYIAKKDSKTLVGFTLDKTCPDGEIVCGKIFFDINGEKGPNKLGVDVFGMEIHNLNLQVFGENQEIKKIKKDCSRFGSGAYCSIYYLRNGRFY